MKSWVYRRPHQRRRRREYHRVRVIIRPDLAAGFVVPWPFTIVDFALHADTGITSGTAYIRVDGVRRDTIALTGVPFHQAVSVDGGAGSELHVELENISNVITNPRASLWLRRRGV